MIKPAPHPSAAAGRRRTRRLRALAEAAHDRYLELYDLAPVGYLTLDAEGLITEANQTGARLLGSPPVRLIGKRFEHHVNPVDHDRWRRHADTLARHGAPNRIELAMLGPQGRNFFAQIDSLRGHCNGRPVLRIALTDISERKRTETELRLAATAFEAQEGMMITDAHGVIERVNQAFTQVTGYSAMEVIGRTARVLHSGRHDAAFYAAMWDSLLRTGFWQGEVWNRRKNGELYAQWLTITAVRTADPAVVRYVGTMLDISLRKAREDEIAQLAFHDPLTGLPNRRLLKDRLQQALVGSARSQQCGALIFIDLDNFKHVNDTLGHDRGDLLLQQVAQRLSESVREGDTVARLGGDEFVVMLAANLSTVTREAVEQARHVGQKILSVLSQPYQVGGEPCRCSASLGVTLFRDHHESIEDLLKHADQAMYQAKAAGRNALCFFDTAVQQALRLRSTVELELRQAMQHGDLMLQFQPVFSQERQLLGAEALVRWRHPRLGLVGPAEFIPLAEDRGLIQGLGRWVLENVCRQLVAWAGDPVMAALSVSVNVSAREMRDPGFADQVIEVIDRTGVNPARLRLELTENMMLDDVEQMIAKMARLKACGVGFALDDFGTGCASLADLKRLPLDQLKIDRSFVRDLLTDVHDAAVARTIVDLGRNLHVTVVAEGVESEAQREVLKDYGCTAFQGFLFGPPAPVETLALMAHRAHQEHAGVPSHR